MKILLASSEVHPFSKTGGLADVVGALGKTLAQAGHEVRVVTPLYQGTRERYPQMKQMELPVEVPLGDQQVKGNIFELPWTERQTIYFVDQPAFFNRASIYQEQGRDYPDNAERFIFFAKVVAQLAMSEIWPPDVLHAHDWQTGLTPLLLREWSRDSSRSVTPRSCFTIHNMAYQGLFPAEQFKLTNLPWEYFTPEGVEFYGKLGCLKAGIAYADVLTTVSPRYAQEITTPEYGCGLDGLLRRRQARLYGVLNRVDYEVWNPAGDPLIPHPFSAEDLAGKAADKSELQKEFGLPIEPKVPLFGNISRLVQQKGMDILLGALEEMAGADLQFVSIGSGEKAYEQGFEDLARRFPGKVAVRVGFDEGLSHRIEAGCDFFLMPSRFEPCGLNQMYSLRYGTIPVVRATGGLDDTVIDVREAAEKANGIKFHEYSSRALAKAIRKALVLYRESELLARFRQNAMAADFSWERMACEYLEVYQKTGAGAKLG